MAAYRNGYGTPGRLNPDGTPAHTRGRRTPIDGTSVAASLGSVAGSHGEYRECQCSPNNTGSVAPRRVETPHG